MMTPDTPAMCAEDVAAAINLGIATLDTIARAWRDDVDLDALDMGNGDSCLIAQVSGMDYMAGLKMFAPVVGNNPDLMARARWDWASARGFILPYDLCISLGLGINGPGKSSDFVAAARPYYRALTEAWKARLA